MPIDIPDDYTEPDAAAPVATVRRQGESQAGQQLRAAGYTDSQLGTGGMRSGESALARSARLALAREKEQRMATNDQQDQANKDREFQLRNNQFTVQQRIHEAAQKDKQTALDQMGYMLDEQDGLAEQFGRGSREYMLGALSIAKKYPAAIMADPRLGQQLNHYDTVLTNAGVSDNVKQAVSEIGQADPSQPNMVGYLDTIPGKYPEIVTDPHIMSLFTAKRRDAAAAQLKREGAAAGLQPDRTTATADGGTVTLTKGEQTNPLKLASQVRGQIRSLSDQVRAHNKELTDIEKDAPEWLKTTGIFADKTGVRRFGLSNVEAEKSPEATPDAEAKFNRYQSARKERDLLEEKLPQLNQQLDDILNGAPQNNPPVATATAAPDENPKKPAPPREVTIPGEEVDHLAKNPSTAKEFDTKYGQGASAAVFEKLKSANAGPKAASLKPLSEDVAKSARAAIAAGKDAKAVAQRLKENGFDPSGL